jgi:hypothetical protein
MRVRKTPEWVWFVPFDAFPEVDPVKPLPEKRQFPTPPLPEQNVSDPSASIGKTADDIGPF